MKSLVKLILILLSLVPFTVGFLIGFLWISAKVGFETSIEAVKKL